MSCLVIVAYKPKPGKERELLAAIREQVRLLRSEQFISDHPISLVRARNGAIIEVFEWCSAQSKRRAYDHPAFRALRNDFSKACYYMPLAQLAESSQIFAEFEPVTL
ncbi:antibiotic biosynthesis monooxygenase family protein [Dyella koreensis]|uniref:ABM domain-containing protein n=1 Tax=Dyella koreensis TaxID=311235 RepID=A0ABW8KAN3_9GAMM